MPSWYDIVGLDERSSEQVEGIEDSVDVVRGIISAELQLGLAPSRIVLAGRTVINSLATHFGFQSGFT